MKVGTTEGRNKYRKGRLYLSLYGVEDVITGNRLHLTTEKGGLVQVDRKNMLEWVASGRTFDTVYEYVGPWGADMTEERQQRWLANHPFHVSNRDGEVFKVHGKGGREPPRAPDDWWREDTDVVSALVKGGYVEFYEVSPKHQKKRQQHQSTGNIVQLHARVGPIVSPSDPDGDQCA